MFEKLIEQKCAMHLPLNCSACITNKNNIDKRARIVTKLVSQRHASRFLIKYFTASVRDTWIPANFMKKNFQSFYNFL